MIKKAVITLRHLKPQERPSSDKKKSFSIAIENVQLLHKFRLVNSAQFAFLITFTERKKQVPFSMAKGNVKRVFSQTLSRGNSKNYIRQRNTRLLEEISEMERSTGARKRKLGPRA